MTDTNTNASGGANVGLNSYTDGLEDMVRKADAETREKMKNVDEANMVDIIDLQTTIETLSLAVMTATNCTKALQTMAESGIRNMN